jgi:uncharacterized membrane protein YfcA
MNSIKLLMVFAAGAIGSSFGTLVGGTALITTPALLLLGLPPHTAVGTNKVGLIGLASAGWYGFNRKGMINYKIGLFICLPAVFGSFFGAHLALQIDEALLKRVIAIITIVILAFIMIRPKAGIEKSRHSPRKYEYWLGMGFCLLLFTYSGFYGAGGGTLLSYILILIFRQTFLESAATRKISNLASNLMAATVFAMDGAISYLSGTILFAGCFLGSYAGAYYSDKIGNTWIKRLFSAVVLIMAVKLLI